MEHLIEKYLHWLRVRNYSERTISNRKSDLYGFSRWCTTYDIENLAVLNRPLLERYQRYLYQLRKTDGQPLSFRTQSAKLGSLQSFYSFLVKKGYLAANPAADLELPRPEKRLPRNILSPEEMTTLLAQPDSVTLLGIRDRAILEVLYSTGIRRMELCNLDFDDLDVGYQTLFIRQGKGKKDRWVPLGESALHWLMLYRDEVRSILSRIGSEDKHMFLTLRGRRLSGKQLGYLVRKYIEQADLDKAGACHMLRHSCATHMLERGADIRYIQQLLGHAAITSTQVYTRVSIQKLQAVHRATHPTGQRQTPDAGS